MMGLIGFIVGVTGIQKGFLQITPKSVLIVELLLLVFFILLLGFLLHQVIDLIADQKAGLEINSCK